MAALEMVTDRWGKEEYQRLRASLDFAPTPWPTLGIVALDMVLLSAAAALLDSRHWLPFITSQVLLSVVFFNSFGLLHECGHGNVSRSSLVNTLLGHYASTFCFIPYFPWKYIHQKHHAWTGNLERDPVLKSLKTWRDRGVPALVRFSWRSWIPLGALLQHVVYWAYPLVMVREGAMTASRLWRSVVSIAWPLSAYGALFLAAPEVAAPSNFVLAIVLYLIAEELVNIPHHADMSTFGEKLPVWEQYRATRSCKYPRGMSELLVLNFNFHTEHHLFPNLPWYRLRAARALVKAALSERYQEAIGIRWNIDGRTRSLESIVDRYRHP